MSGAVTETQKALYDALTGDAALTSLVGTRVYDRVPQDAPFPYVTLGGASAFDWSTGTETGTEMLVTLHVWSRARGSREALAILDAIVARLHGGTVALEGHRLVNLRMQASEVRFDEDLALQHGFVRFRIVTEATA